MCGIVGFTGEAAPDKLNIMLKSETHRGPDDEAIISNAPFHCGMRRLSIIDLSPNIYPIKSENEQVECLYNGEIYNYQSLREELKEKGHEFKTQSDSEVIVHGYEEWGLNVFSRLRGMFAIALFDKQKNEMILCRDRLGIKPLYYAEHNGRIIFASEIKAILAGWDVDRTPDDFSVYKFLITRVHDDTKRTFFKNIKRLMPGHYMTIDSQGNYRLTKYWSPKVNPEFRSSKPDEVYAEELKEKLLESMKLHLISDVPLGVTLSGGLDSSAVTSIASQMLKDGADLHTDHKLLTFSAVHPNETIDESEYINEVLEYTGAESHKIAPNVDVFWGEIDEWVYFQEEPTISTAPYAYYTVMREAHKHVRVLLSGQGGDELFAGYIPYFMSYVNSARDAGAYMDIMREGIKGFDLYSSFIRQKLDTALNKGKQINIFDMINKHEVDELEQTDSIYFKHKRNLNERLFQDLTASSVPSLLRYEDKNSMAHSIESRVPFLDHEYVEHVFSLPIDQKIKMGWNRYVYRNAMKGMMPEKNRLRRSKIGFVNSEWEWLQAKADIIREIFNSDSFRSRKYWNADKILSEFNLWIAGKKRGDGLMFWRILSTELWMRGFVDNFRVLTQEL
jgi:asparagine synthase (glutamine-hydrolysing)